MRKKIFIATGLFILGLLVGMLATDYATQQQPEIGEQTSMAALLGTNQTSSAFIARYMQLRQIKGWEQDAAGERQRLAMTHDLRIKSGSYKIINSVFFGLSLLLGFVVISWPIVQLLVPDNVAKKYPVFSSAVVQTVLTALAATSFFVYSDYKARQNSTENLMRYVVYSEATTAEVSKRVMKELEQVDRGVNFSQAFSLNPDE